MSDKMLKIIELVVLDSLSHKSLSKTRDYLYFKKYLLNSTIWHQTVENNDTTVYDVILNAIQVPLEENKKFVFEQLAYTAAWHDLRNKKINISGPNNGNDEKEDGINVELRQDNLACNKAEYTSDALTQSSTFDALKEYESKIYLTKLLIKANNLNNFFQSQMKSFIANEAPEHGKYASAPIKTIERCLIKAQTDYRNAKYPRTASIVDLVRCSITFDSGKVMARVIRKFQKMIESKETRCIKSILRTKNGFEQIGSDLTIDECDYRDIKMNVLISNRDGSEQVIGEIQWLLMYFY